MTPRVRMVAPLVFASLAAGCADDAAPSAVEVARLQAGVIDEEVRDLLGEPDHLGVGSKPNWHYQWRRRDGGGGNCHLLVVFDLHTLKVVHYLLNLQSANRSETVDSWPTQLGSPTLASACLEDGAVRRHAGL